jgi:hypothetical protein
MPTNRQLWEIMATDIKLDDGQGNQVVLESDILRSTASDFMLDAPSRRGSGGPRRALVHDGSDGLTINFNGDYPGGVTAGSALTVQGDLTVTGKVVWGSAPVSPSVDRELDSLRWRVQYLERTLEQLLPFIGYSVVPAWRNLEEVENGDDMGMLYQSAEVLKLNVQYIFVEGVPDDHQADDVIKISPYPGTLLPHWSTVKVTICREA